MKQLKQMKKGFSLVEVMVIFTLLSAVLAASIPMITRKANPVPAKISHGVYRCINTGVGSFLQELYSGTRRIKSERVTSCSFNVPKAPTYKVDMYSAGTGGTEYGEVNSNYNDSRNTIFSMEGTTSGGEPIIRPGENELYEMFNGRYLIRNVFTGDAGDGGNATLAFQSPYDAYCDIGQHGKEFWEFYQNEINIRQEKINLLRSITNNAIAKTNSWRGSTRSDNIEALVAGWPNIYGHTFKYLYDNDAKLRLHAGDEDEDSSYGCFDQNGIWRNCTLRYALELYNNTNAQLTTCNGYPENWVGKYYKYGFSGWGAYSGVAKYSHTGSRVECINTCNQTLNDER